MEVLRSFFGEQPISSLYDYMAVLCPDGAPCLLNHSDPDRFREFLHRTVIIACEGPGEPIPTIRRPSCFSIDSSMKQILEQVQQRFHSRKNNVLAIDEFEWRSWNTIRNHLLNPNWTRLLERVGDEAVRILLMRCSVFESLSNGCYLQVSGKALYSCKIKNLGARSRQHMIRCVDMLYSRTERLSSYHILNQAAKTEDPAMKLLAFIFDPLPKKLNRSYQRLLPFLRAMIKNHAKLNYQRLLKATCPIPDEVLTQQMPAEYGAEIRLLLQRFTPVQNVSRFLRYVVLRVIPAKIWGSKPNFAVICRAIHSLTNLRQKDTVDVHYLMQGFKISHCPWIFSNGGRSGAVQSQYVQVGLYSVLPS